MKTKTNGHVKPHDNAMLREFLRHLEALEGRIETRHEQLMGEVRDFRRLALGVITQRTDIDQRLREVEEKVKKLEEARP